MSVYICMYLLIYTAPFNNLPRVQVLYMMRGVMVILLYSLQVYSVESCSFDQEFSLSINTLVLSAENKIYFMDVSDLFLSQSYLQVPRSRSCITEPSS